MNDTTLTRYLEISTEEFTEVENIFLTLSAGKPPQSVQVVFLKFY